MIKPRFWDEEPETAFQYLIKENPLIKDNQTAQEVLETLFDKVTFFKEINSRRWYRSLFILC